MVETILGVLLVLALATLPALFWVLLATKRSKRVSTSSMNAGTRGPRYRDGGVTYSQYRGVRYNIVPENPNEPHNARYARRHHARRTSKRNRG